MARPLGSICIWPAQCRLVCPVLHFNRKLKSLARGSVHLFFNFYDKTFNVQKIGKLYKVYKIKQRL